MTFRKGRPVISRRQGLRLEDDAHNSRIRSVPPKGQKQEEAVDPDVEIQFNGAPPVTLGDLLSRKMGGMKPCP